MTHHHHLHRWYSAKWVAFQITTTNKAVVLPYETVENKVGEMGWSATNTMPIVRNVGALKLEYEVTVPEAV